LVAAGAILRYAVTAQLSEFDPQTAGVVLIVIGGLRLLIGLWLLVHGHYWTTTREHESG
jgi:hypothetical protein